MSLNPITRGKKQKARVLLQQNRLEEAKALLERVCATDRRDAEAWHILGTVHWRSGRIEDALASFQRALEIKPDDRRVHGMLGSLLARQGRPEEAAASFRRALAIKPDDPDTLSNLGVVLTGQGLLEEAVASYRQSLAIKPDDPDTLSNLGFSLTGLNRLGEAVAACQRALDTGPGNPNALNNLGLALAQQGRLDEALASFRRALEIDPGNASICNNYVFFINGSPRHDAAAIYAEHRRCAALLTGIPQSLDYANVRDPDRRLRVGYISPDFRTHSVAYFIEAALSHHDKALYEIHVYADVKQPDDVTERFRKKISLWHDIHGLADPQVIKKIQADGIDILVDLAGYTDRNRLNVFAHKPAPVQATYLGYANTTGLLAMDYRLTDIWADPPGQEAFHTETLVRLPQGFLCYTPRPDAPAAAPAALQAGHVTFGSFNAMAKITPEVVRLWARILQALPTARLMIKNKSLQDPATRTRCLSLFEEQGIPPARLDLAETVPTVPGHLALYNRLDIALDTFPYNGTTTTCEAMWMGVPVVTLEGDRHAGRVGVSLLNQVGLTELIAKTPEDYVQIAVGLANDLDKLATLRNGLRERMANSPLCDGKGFARVLEEAYREMWKKWCVGKVGR